MTTTAHARLAVSNGHISPVFVEQLNYNSKSQFQTESQSQACNVYAEATLVGNDVWGRLEFMQENPEKMCSMQGIISVKIKKNAERIKRILLIAIDYGELMEAEWNIIRKNDNKHEQKYIVLSAVDVPEAEDAKEEQTLQIKIDDSAKIWLTYRRDPAIGKCVLAIEDGKEQHSKEKPLAVGTMREWSGKQSNTCSQGEIAQMQNVDHMKKRNCLQANL